MIKKRRIWISILWNIHLVVRLRPLFSHFRGKWFYLKLFLETSLLDFFQVCAGCAQCRRLTQNHFLKKTLIKSREGAIQPSRNGWSGFGWQNWPSTQMHKHGRASIWPSNRLWFRTQPIVRLIQNQEAEYDFGCNWLADWMQNYKECSTIKTKCVILESENIITSLE